jgi:hypothetical protein
MPTITLPQQTGNSCAAHCTVVAVVEITASQSILTTVFAEGTLWPAIQFTGNDGPVSQKLKADHNSDPRLIVSEVASRWGGSLTSTMLFDDTEKTTALTFVSDPMMQQALPGLFNLLKGQTQSSMIIPKDGIFYNCSYVMLKGATASSAKFEGLHNILITSDSGALYYYNPNEATPAWVKNPPDWKTLQGLNGGTYCYIFTGVAVELKKK